MKKQNPGYHMRVIRRGVLGESSKIMEELREMMDSEQQGVKIMTLVELSDIVGAIKFYLEKHMPDFTLNDLEKMANVTRRAFENGRR